jgi:hypothetical protein
MVNVGEGAKLYNPQKRQGLYIQRASSFAAMYKVWCHGRPRFHSGGNAVMFDFYNGLLERLDPAMSGHSTWAADMSPR